MYIDYWYKGAHKDKYFADCFFYPNEGIYRGNIYNKKGKMIGDYSSRDSLEIEKTFPGIFGN